MATLHGKVGKFALMREETAPGPEPDMEAESLQKQVEEVLVRDLGHRQTEARALVREAMARNPAISTPEELFEEVYRGKKAEPL